MFLSMWFLMRLEMNLKMPVYDFDKSSERTHTTLFSRGRQLNARSWKIMKNYFHLLRN